jgi:hypothetical protein
VSDRRVDILNRRDAPLHEVESLAPQRRLKTIGDMALDFAPDANRLLADRLVEGQRLLDGMFGCQAAADHLDQRYQLRRIERMTISAHGVILRTVALRHHFNTEKRVSIVTSRPVDPVGTGGSDT